MVNRSCEFGSHRPVDERRDEKSCGQSKGKGEKGERAEDEVISRLNR